MNNIKITFEIFLSQGIQKSNVDSRLWKGHKIKQKHGFGSSKEHMILDKTGNSGFFYKMNRVFKNTNMIFNYGT